MTGAGLIAALRGIASCATNCPCCEMHRRVAQKTLDEYFALRRRVASHLPGESYQPVASSGTPKQPPRKP